MIDIEKLIEQAAEKANSHRDACEWYAWPHVFASTSGPHGGAGGCMMTKFQVIAFRFNNGVKIKTCAGKWKQWNGKDMWGW